MPKAPEQQKFSCRFFLWEHLCFCVLFLYIAKSADEPALKCSLEFRNSEMYSKDYEVDFFFFYSFCKMNSYFSDSGFLLGGFPTLKRDEVTFDLGVPELW